MKLGGGKSRGCPLILSFWLYSFNTLVLRQLIGVLLKDIAIGAGGLGLDSRAGQIGHSRKQLAYAATFLYCSGA